MKVLLLGSGGREHALARQIAKSPLLTALYIAPGNPGTSEVGENLDLDITDNAAIVTAAETHAVDLVVVGPEAPLVAGAGDALRRAGFAVFGPNRAAAALEGSKAFAKTVMEAAAVPTAAAVPCATLEQASAALQRFGAPYVVKQDGLAAGKGVVVTSDFDAAMQHAQACIDALGPAAGRETALIIEEYLDGPEASVFCLSDGHDVVALPPAQDFKRAYDHNEGPNTGGMGAYTPLPWAPANLAADTARDIAAPVVAHMARAGTPFVGLLYVGLALTSRGPRVVEFNVRFGDPETQSVLESLDADLLALLHAAATGELARVAPPGTQVPATSKAVVNVVLAAPGYPESPVKGGVISGVEDAAAIAGVHVIHAGTARGEDGTLVSAGGRVLSVVATGDDVAAARERAYAAMAKISLPGGHFRSDIALF